MPKKNSSHSNSLLLGISEGPWRASTPCVDDREETVILIKARKVIVGVVFSGDESEGVANANLIANAPGVIKAAMSVLKWYDRDGSVGGAVDPMENLRQALFQ